jgi:hypothetical protein
VSTVYCRPDVLLRAARKLAAERNVVDMRLYAECDRERMLVQIIAGLREAKMLAPDIVGVYHGRHYEVRLFNKTDPVPFYAVPIKIEMVGIPAALEQRKEGWLQLIQSVKPVYNAFLRRKYAVASGS